MYHPSFYRLVLSLCFFVVMLQMRSSLCQNITVKPSVEKTLIRKLLDSYQEFGIIGRPVNDSTSKLTVYYGLSLIQILDLDENKQILRTNCWCNYKWQDDLMTWDMKSYNQINVVRIFPDQLWTPDIRLYNFADERMKEQREARVLVYNNGLVTWIPQALFKSTCPVEISYFPFDTQICKLEFGSWTYDITKLDIDWLSTDSWPNATMEYIDFQDYVKSNEWHTDGEEEHEINPMFRKKQIKSVKRIRKRNHTDTDGNIVTKEYPVLIYLVRLRRNYVFFVSMLVLPCMLLSSLTLVVFWLPPESPAKMLLGMNIFVAFFVLMLLLAESTPSAVKNFPLIGAYFCLNMIMITLSTFLATFVINLYFRGDRNGPLSSVLRKVIVEGLGSFLCVRQYIPLPDEKKLMNHVVTRSITGRVRRKVHVPQLKSNKFMMTDTEEALSINQPSDNQQTPNQSYQEKTYRPFTHCAHEMPSFEESAADSCHYSLKGNNPNNSTPRIVGRPCQVDSEDSPILMNSGSCLERDIREMKRYIRMFVNRQKENDRKNILAMEWRTMALVLDRLFFFMYITTIAVSVIISLPSTTEPVLDAHLRDD